MSLTVKTIPAPSAPGVHPRALWSLKPRSDRESGDAVVANFLLHWFPAKAFKASLDWTYSFWLGTITSALFLLLILSGLPLLFLYVPSVERAYASVKDIEYVITFGSWIRSVHRLSAHLMVAVVFLHLARVFLTGAYKNGTGRGQRREWNWVIGVVMFLVFSLVYMWAWGMIGSRTAVGVEAFKSLITHNALYWTACILMVALGIVIVRIWPVKVTP